MSVLESLLVKPFPGLLGFFHTIFVLSQVWFVVFCGLLFGSTLLALALALKAKLANDSNSLNQAKTISNLPFKNYSILSALGLVFIPTLAASAGTLVYGSATSVAAYMLAAGAYSVVALTSAGLLALQINKTASTNLSLNPTQILFGLIALGATLKAMVLYATAMLVIGDESLWSGAASFLGVFGYSVGVARTLLFILSALIITGIVLILSGQKDAGYKWVLWGVIPMPILQTVLIWYMPESSINAAGPVWQIVSMLLLFAVFHFAWFLKEGSKLALGVPLLIFTLLAFTAQGIADGVQIAYGTQVHRQIQKQEAFKNLGYAFQTTGSKLVVANSASQKNEDPQSNTAPILYDLTLGKKIYDTQCNACHKWNEKLVGPAHNQVVAKYLDKPAALIEFIKNPTRVNPEEFPAPMTPLGLTSKEATAVAGYIITRYKEETGIGHE
jgi:cytochrome c551/c552